MLRPGEEERWGGEELAPVGSQEQVLRPGEEEHWGGEEPAPVGSPVIER